MKEADAAYLAGFMDGDGSIHFQLVRQSEYKYGFYIRASLSLTQSTTARAGLEELQRRLRAVEPYVVFKREHVVRALGLLGKVRPRPQPRSSSTGHARPIPLPP